MGVELQPAPWSVAHSNLKPVIDRVKGVGAEVIASEIAIDPARTLVTSPPNYWRAEQFGVRLEF